MTSNKKTTWGAKNIILSLVMLILAVAVFYDYFPQTKGTQTKGSIPDNKVTIIKAPINKTSDEQWINKKLYARQLQRNKQIIASKKQIHEAYANIALPYAMQMAELRTFHRDQAVSEEQVIKYVEKMLPGDGSIKLEKLSIDKKQQTDGNQIFTASVKLKSYTHQSVFSLLNQWGNFHKVLGWEDFYVFVDRKQHQISLTGHLSIIFIRSIE